MAQLLYSSIADSFYIRVDNEHGYGLPYEIVGSEGSYVSGTTNANGVSTQVIYNGKVWFPDYDNETLELYIGNDYAYKGSWCWNGSSLSEGTCEENPDLNIPFALYYYEVILNSYNKNTGIADITVSCYYENLNDIEAYGHAICGIVGYEPYSTRKDMWVDADEIFIVERRYTNFYVGTLPIELEIYSYAFCYQEPYATSGLMAVETNTPEVILELSRPDEFYWRSNYSDLETGDEISRYITASKWQALQNNVNLVRVYNDFDSYPFTKVYKGDRIKASLYNEIAEAINEMESDTVSIVNKGDPITASIMMDLQNGINGIK